MGESSKLFVYTNLSWHTVVFVTAYCCAGVKAKLDGEFVDRSSPKIDMHMSTAMAATVATHA